MKKAIRMALKKRAKTTNRGIQVESSLWRSSEDSWPTMFIKAHQGWGLQNLSSINLVFQQNLHNTPRSGHDLVV